MSHAIIKNSHTSFLFCFRSYYETCIEEAHMDPKQYYTAEHTSDVKWEGVRKKYENGVSELVANRSYNWVVFHCKYQKVTEGKWLKRRKRRVCVLVFLLSRHSLCICVSMHLSSCLFSCLNSCDIHFIIQSAQSFTWRQPPTRQQTL